MKFDVQKAEDEYVTTDISYRRLAEKYEVSKTIISRYGAERQWAEKRRKFRSKVSQRFIEKATTKETNKLTKLIATTDKAIEVVSKNIDGYMKVISDGDLMPMKELKPAISALKELVDIQRDLNGILNTKDQQAIDIAREKLALEKEKANFGEEDNGQTGVVILPATIDDVLDEDVVKEGEVNA